LVLVEQMEIHLLMQQMAVHQYLIQSLLQVVAAVHH
jgi:hypothetical protein